jgi:hypothetical protein
MIFERSNKDYGSGAGRTFFEGKLFRVVRMRCQRGCYTEISLNNSLYSFEPIVIDGLVDIASDQQCIQQLTSEEFEKIIESVENEAFEQGRSHKSKEIKAVLGIY